MGAKCNRTNPGAKGCVSSISKKNITKGKVIQSTEPGKELCLYRGGTIVRLAWAGPGRNDRCRRFRLLSCAFKQKLHLLSKSNRMVLYNAGLPKQSSEIPSTNMISTSSTVCPGSARCCSIFVDQAGSFITSYNSRISNSF